MLSLSAGHYLIPPPDYFWSWEPGEGVAVLVSGRTLAFGSELLPLLEPLASDLGLPPLGSVLLVLAAARSPDSVEESKEVLDGFARMLGKDGDQMPYTLSRFFGPAMRVLEMVARLPADLRESQSARLRVLNAVFADTFNLLPQDRSREILFEFRQHFPVFGDAETDLTGLTRLLRDLKALESASRLCAEELENRIRTGVVKVSVKDVDVDLEEAMPDGGELWSALEKSQNPELQAVSHVASQMLAVLRLPRPVYRQDDQPTGGVSDIAPRGDPARLLLSELAWDDATFSARLAHGEALYLLRETPPASPCPERIILIDSGLLLWGRPRIYVTAVALALKRQLGEGLMARMRGHLDGIWEDLKLETVPDLRNWWSQLQILPHGGEALESFLGELSHLAPADQPEVVWVTHPEAHEDIAPRLRARSWPLGSRFFTAMVNGEGRFSLLRRTASGDLVLNRIQLDVPAALCPA